LLDHPGAPKPKLEDEEGKGNTVDYDRLVQAWRDGLIGR
jgi:glycerol transport system substrate-binding protein